MALSTDLISQFVKATKDDNKETKAVTTLYGTIRLSDKEGAKPEVQLDGSSTWIPVETTVETTVDVRNNDRVIVTIKNHKAVITGNLTSPAVQHKTVEVVTEQVSTKVSTDVIEAKFATVDTIIAENATIKQLSTDVATVNSLVAGKASITQFQTEQLRVDGLFSGQSAQITDLVAADVTVNNKLNAANSEINNLKTTKLDATNAAATYATIENLNAANTSIANLQNEKLSSEQASLIYANIDFSNIGDAAIEKFFSVSGLIENVVIGDGTVTGTLVGVTIKGDLIEGGTVVADKLVMRGEDGLYYKLNTDGVTTEAEQTDYNSINGSIITAHSITATKIAVDDLVAFDATIGGFNITTDSIYSGVKESIDNSTRGIHLSTDGQVSFGDSENYIRYYRDDNGDWKLEISAESILFGAESKSSAADIKTLTEHVKIGTYMNPNTAEMEPCVELSEGDSDFKQLITNTSTVFMDGNDVRTEIDAEGVTSENIIVKNELRQGNFMWKSRPNGNLGLIMMSTQYKTLTNSDDEVLLTSDDETLYV